MHVDQLYRQFNLQRTAITHDVHVHDRYADPPTSAFVQALASLSGWLIGLSGVLFVTSLLFQLHGLDMYTLWPANFGIGLAFVVFGWSMRIMPIPESVANGLVIGGLVFASLASTIYFSGRVFPAFLLTAGVLLLSIRFGAKLEMQGLVASILSGLMGVAVFQELVLLYPIGSVGWIFALQVAVGVVLFLFPPRIDLRPLAGVALVSGVVSPMIGQIFLELPETQPAILAGQLINLVVMLFILAVAWLGSIQASQRIGVITIAILCMPATLILPQPGSSALIVLLLAWCRGSWPIAVIGCLLELAFLIHYFQDQSPSLLYRVPTIFEKSLVVGCIGMVFLALSRIVALFRRSPVFGLDGES
ncbi:MAG TPA: hypothetical protein VK862_05870 [Afifellaceae bacterium]|nr:hypothetical protein [Afifellaceae bacterium]